MTPHDPMTPSPFFHEASGAVRFWVVSRDNDVVGATIGKETLHYRFQAELSGADALATYNAHRDEIDEAVRRRIALGSIEPVMLRETDVAASR